MKHEVSVVGKDKTEIIEKNDNIVEKANTLNTLRNLSIGDGMDLTEFRFFCLYLSKLNARNPQKRTVLIPMAEFEQLFNVSVHTTRFANKISKISTRQMRIREDKKFRVINIYSSFSWVDDAKCKEVEVTCNYDMLPYLFELKENYTAYKIVNIVHLNSVPKIRLYEICKQYQKLKKLKIDPYELQEMMCCKLVEFKFFKRDTLDPAIKDINQHTDITVSYEKNLMHRKVVALTFNILSKNPTPEPTFEPILEPIPTPKPTQQEVPSKTRANAVTANATLESLYYKCNQVYTMEELMDLVEYINGVGMHLNCPIENYIFSVYHSIKNRRIKRWYNYTKQIVEDDFKRQALSMNEVVESKSTPKSKPQCGIEVNYDVQEFATSIHVGARFMGGHAIKVFDADGVVRAYIYEHDFFTIRDGSWKVKYPFHSLDDYTNMNVSLSELLNPNIPLEMLYRQY